jgi:adenylate kinase
MRTLEVLTMWLSLTGTPGTGKTAVADVLRSRGVVVIDLNTIVKEHGFVIEMDEARDTAVADIDAVAGFLEREFGGVEDLVLEGHWSHRLQVTGAVVLRCDPVVLGKRLAGRGYREAKVKENVEAEVVDVILVEAVEGLGKDRVAEMDTTDMDVEAVADAVLRVANGDFNRYKVGRVDWSGQLLDDG